MTIHKVVSVIRALFEDTRENKEQHIEKFYVFKRKIVLDSEASDVHFFSFHEDTINFCRTHYMF